MSAFHSTIRFDNDRNVDVDMTTVSLSGAWFISEVWTVRVGLGMILSGELKPDAGTSHDVNPGGIASVGFEYIAHVGADYTPSIDLSLFISGSMTETTHTLTDKNTRYFASDARLSARAGWNLKGNIFPYAAARVFGGPVRWELDGKDITGGDIHHYQLAIGTAARIGLFSAYFEWAGRGEQAVSAGLGVAW